MPGAPNAEHSGIAVSMGTVIANRVADLLPAIQQHLLAGGEERGLTARITFRPGQPHEAPVVGEIEFSVLSGDDHQWLIAPSAETGQFTMLSFSDPAGANGVAPQYPQQQMPPQATAPVPQRRELPPPPAGLEGPVPFAPLTGPLTPAPAPAPQAPQQQANSALMQQLANVLTPEQLAAIGASQPAAAQPAAPVRRGPTNRLRRPPMRGDEGMS